MPDGRIGHAELQIAGARVFLSDEHPESGFAAPASGAGSAVSLHLDVPDVDAVTARVAAANARVEREPSDNPYGRIGVIRDPFGHRWMLNSPRAAAFSADVLGWTYAEDNGPSRTVVGTAVPHRITALADAPGVLADQQHATLFCSRGVTDLDAPSSGCARPAAPRPTRSGSRTASLPSVPTTRARRSTWASCDDLGGRRAPTGVDSAGNARGRPPRLPVLSRRRQDLRHAAG
jgi:predicted enzyme related to lactoylglutathione lyase